MDGLGFVELRAANPSVNPWVPLAGSQILLPTAHIVPGNKGAEIVINLADQRLYLFDRAGRIHRSRPIGVGRAGFETPVGRTVVAGKRRNPVWRPPPSVRTKRPDLPAKVCPGPGNPLGAYAIDLGWPMISLHATNRSYGIDRRVSHGCVRLLHDDIAELFEVVEVSTAVLVIMAVLVIDQPVKPGWFKDELYLEGHPTQSQADQLEELGSFTPASPGDLALRVVDAAGGEIGRVDWNSVRRAATARPGIPFQITR